MNETERWRRFSTAPPDDLERRAVLQNPKRVRALARALLAGEVEASPVEAARWTHAVAQLRARFTEPPLSVDPPEHAPPGRRAFGWVGAALLVAAGLALWIRPQPPPEAERPPAIAPPLDPAGRLIARGAADPAARPIRVGYRIDGAGAAPLLGPLDERLAVTPRTSVSIDQYSVAPEVSHGAVWLVMPYGPSRVAPPVALGPRDAGRRARWPDGLPAGTRAVVLVYGPSAAAVAAAPEVGSPARRVERREGERWVVVLPVEFVGAETPR